MPRALVTGAGGFVGPHLVAALAARGFEVWTCDRQPYQQPAGSAAGCSPLDPTKHIVCDLADPDAVRSLFLRTTPDHIYHLASQSSVARSFEAPLETLQGNLGAACNVLEALRHVRPAARLLVVGSAEQYGNVPEPEQPIPETQPFRPASPYAVSKVAQEHLAVQYATAFDLDIVLARSFNHSGPGQSERFVLPGFARQVARVEAGRQEPVLRVGNLDVRRDFLDVRDVVQAYIQLVERGERAIAYNICSGVAPRVRDLLDALLARASRPVSVEVDPARWRAADLPVLCGDPARVRERTGWRPRLPIEQTLGDILDDWRQRSARESAA